MALRTFICKDCSGSWQTPESGRFTLCPTCKCSKETNKRTKICGYRHCGASFVDGSKQNSMSFCCPEHRRREKLFRSGLAKDESYFRDNKPKLETLCVSCGERWARDTLDKAVRCPKCRDLARHKVCNICKQELLDTSLKNTRKAHPSCVLGVIDSTIRPAVRARSLEGHRREGVRSGSNGRLDDFKTLKKFTTTWWGRVTELIYSKYHPQALDTNIEAGSRTSFDFNGPRYGKLNVKGAKARLTPEGRYAWYFLIGGLKESCESAFLVGYNQEMTEVVRMWLIPVSELPDISLRMAPGSAEYMWEGTELLWDKSVAQGVLEECLASPEPVKPSSKFAWLDDPTQLHSRSPGHRGRRGELLYKQLYSDSVDMNLSGGSGSLFDFADADGTRVNVKTSRLMLRSDIAVSRWSFSRGFLDAHNCDTYSCLCLDALGELVREYRIPSSVWGPKRVIHICAHGGQWQNYQVSLSQEGLLVSSGDFTTSVTKDRELEQVAELIRKVPRDSDSVVNTVVELLLRVPFPQREYTQEQLKKDFLAVVNSTSIRLVGDELCGSSNVGLSLCEAFFPHRFEASYKNYPSIKEAWDDRVWLERAVKFQLAVGDPLLPWNVFRALKICLRAPSNFRPTVAQAIIQEYSSEGDLILDPCAGFGGRAVGALASDRRYIGIDPHPMARNSLIDMAKFLGMPSNLTAIEAPFENVDLGDTQADMAFTSPPYFSVERYSKTSEQSWVRYPTWDTWRDGFLKAFINKTYKHLKPGAVFCLNIADAKFRSKVYPLVKASIDFALLAGFVHERTITMPLGRVGKNVRKEPILVFRKPGKCVVSPCDAFYED